MKIIIIIHRMKQPVERKTKWLILSTHNLMRTSYNNVWNLADAMSKPNTLYCAYVLPSPLQFCAIARARSETKNTIKETKKNKYSK